MLSTGVHNVPAVALLTVACCSESTEAQTPRTFTKVADITVLTDMEVAGLTFVSLHLIGKAVTILSLLPLVDAMRTDVLVLVATIR